MNLTQAKEIAGIAPSLKIAGAGGATYALAEIKKRMTEARKLGEDNPALPALGEAKALFKQMLNRFCPVCGVKIARGAKACALHGRVKAKLFPADQTLKLPKGRNPRVDVAPEGGPLARLGYYAPEVQKVVAKWQSAVPAGHIEYYFQKLASIAAGHSTTLELKFITPNYIPLISQLGNAITKDRSDTNSATCWLLKLPIGVATGGRFSPWRDVAAEIKRAGGPDLSPAALKSEAKRLRLLTPKHLAKEWQGFWRIRNAP